MRASVNKQQLWGKFRSNSNSARALRLIPKRIPTLNLGIAPKRLGVAFEGIAGYYNPLSGEANLNFLLPQWVLPFVACHEIAHQIGVAREDEANLVGYLTAVNSDDVSFRYSANYNMLRYLLFEVRIKSPENYALLYQKILPGVIANFKAERDFWQKYNSDMSGYMNIAFDKFLKLNNQQNGIKSYQNIVIWLWNLHKAELIGERTSRE